MIKVLMKLYLQKRIRSCESLWKSPRLSDSGAIKGLQCGLSGNREMFSVTKHRKLKGEPPNVVTLGVSWGNPSRT